MATRLRCCAEYNLWSDAEVNVLLTYYVAGADMDMLLVILPRRIEDEYIDVPHEGFFPEGKPEELYNWPQREQLFLKEKMVRITHWTDDLALCAGQWASIVEGTTQYIQTREGQ